MRLPFQLVPQYTRSIKGEAGLVWPGTWTKKAAEMIRIDLETAGIDYSVDGSDYEADPICEFAADPVSSNWLAQQECRFGSF